MATQPQKRKYFENLVELSKKNETFEKRTFQALTWYRNKVRDVFGTRDTPPELFFDKNNYPNRPIPGNIVTFRYNPSNKNTLPFYDVFPLVLILRIVPGGFIGLNFHYIHPMDRAVFMSKLQRYERPFPDGTIKLNIRYSTLKNVGGLPFHEECVKRYKRANIRTMFYTLTPEEWDIALFLPTEKFVNKTKQNVWKEAKERLRNKKKV